MILPVKVHIYFFHKKILNDYLKNNKIIKIKKYFLLYLVVSMELYNILIILLIIYLL